MRLFLACFLSLALALITAALLFRRDRQHLPVVLALAAGLAADAVMGHRDAWGIATVIRRSTDNVPLWHVSNALVTLWPAAVAALALTAFGRKKAPRSVNPGAEGVTGSERANRNAGSMMPRAPFVKVGLAWATANALLVAVYPLSEVDTQRALLTWEAGCVATGVLAAILAWGDTWSSPQRAALWLVAIEFVVVVAGPFRYSVYERWDIARAVYALGFAALAVAQIDAVRRLRPKQAGST